jgi:hypothetical protein
VRFSQPESHHRMRYRYRGNLSIDAADRPHGCRRDGVDGSADYGRAII